MKRYEEDIVYLEQEIEACNNGTENSVDGKKVFLSRQNCSNFESKLLKIGIKTHRRTNAIKGMKFSRILIALVMTLVPGLTSVVETIQFVRGNVTLTRVTAA